MVLIDTNKYQTPITEELRDSLSTEVWNDFLEIITNVEFIKNLISPDRQRAKDRPRDSFGRIIVDICKPHILENMDYFRPAAIHYQKYGCYTKLRPDANPKSEFGMWLTREVRRCLDGMVRPEDGEWIPGDFYFYLNYLPIIQTKIRKGTRIGDRVVDFPECWEGVYLRAHYQYQARNGGLYDDFVGGKHSVEIASRGKSKSYYAAAILCKFFLLGENSISYDKVKCLVTAYQKEYLIKDGTLNKFIDGIDFCAKNTQFPRARLKNSLSEMQWISGYIDKDSMIPRGSQNEVLGVAVKDDPDKIRGKRSNRMLYEEFGTFPKFLDVWQTALPNVQENAAAAFGQAIAFGTGGSEGSDFMGALEMINYPDGYSVYSLPNVFDKGAVGARRTIFFFPSYLNSKGFYNEDGVSDVVGAILEEIKHRVILKYNSSDPIQLTRRKAEYAFTITDAIMRRDSNIFPSDKLNDRILELDQNPKSLDDMWVGRLVQTKEGKVEFTPDADVKPVLDYPHKDNKLEGAVHINKMPIKGPDGKVPWGRYIAGADPYDDDVSDTMSLGSIYVLDLFTDELVCEYVGRPMFAEDYYETCRRICLFYNAELLYENNKKGLFTYFSKTNCLYLLSDIPEFLKDKEIVKGNFFGNKAKGVNATQPVQTYGRTRIRDWLLKPLKVVTKVTIDGHEEEAEITINNINRCYYRALMKELSMWNPDSNFDRYDALLMLMLLREQKLMLCGNLSPSEVINVDQADYLGNDDFFTRNYDYRFAKYLHKDN